MRVNSATPETQVLSLFSKITDKFYNERFTHIAMLIEVCNVI